MSVALTPDEARKIAEYPPHLIKRYSPGESSNWDDRPFKQRHAEMATKAAARRNKRRVQRAYP